MQMQRASGLLTHPTSLPSPYGIGDLGKGAYKFIDFMHQAGQKLWQILPLGPTGYGDSPYQSFSTFAGNHYLISPDLLCEEGYLTVNDLEDIPAFKSTSVDYGSVIEYKMNLYHKAFKAFQINATPEQEQAYTKFCKQHKKWLYNYTLFVAVKEHFIEKRKMEKDTAAQDAFRTNNEKFLTKSQIKDYYYGAVWNSWPTDIAKGTKEAIIQYQKLLAEEIRFHSFLQYEFFRQWDIVRKYANKKGIKIIGDVPIFVAIDSSDVWAEPELFQLDKLGNPKAVAGVPPDYFSETGQLREFNQI